MEYAGLLAALGDLENAADVAPPPIRKFLHPRAELSTMREIGR